MTVAGVTPETSRTQPDDASDLEHLVVALDFEPVDLALFNAAARITDAG